LGIRIVFKKPLAPEEPGASPINAMPWLWSSIGKNQVTFGSESEAQAAGFRKADNCKQL
jgi:hypothetical protein